MKIIQITDLHIAGEGMLSHGINCLSNFDQILIKVQAEMPDLIVVTGDLCFEEGEKIVYNLIKERLDATQLPYCVLSGNHDDSKILAKVFGYDLINVECYYALHNFRSLFLDTAVGEMSDKQFNWLEDKLNGETQYDYIFMHHPPVDGRIKFFENSPWRFKQMTKFQNLINSVGRNIYIFCGHYHVDRVITIDNMTCYITPSCYMQIADNQEDFTSDHLIPSYRRIEIEEGRITTTLRYLFDYNTNV